MERIDAQVRATRPDRSVILSASAGSGKTRALVMRMIHLMAAGVSPGEIVAATFSEKAAAQMEDRLYDTLADAAAKGLDARALLMLGPEDAPYPLSRTPEEILAGLASRPDQLRISTIHALCLWILRRFPLEAGLSPDFSVMDDWELPLRREEAVDACLAEVPAGRLTEEFVTLASLGYGASGIRSLILAAFEKRPHIMKLAVDAGGPDGITGARAALAERQAADAAGSVGGRAVQRIAGGLAELLADNGLAGTAYASALAALSGVTDIEGFKDAFAGISGFFFTRQGGLQKNTPLSGKAAKEAVKAASPGLRGGQLDDEARALKARHDEMYEDLRREATGLAGLIDTAEAGRALCALLRLFFRSVELYDAANRAEGLVDYDDLEICAYRLITRPDFAGLAAHLESRAAHYLVDEFQDTGELQWGILSALGSEVFSGMGAEGVKSPTLFAVGDKKQSIYRFRMANHLLMDALRRRMEDTVAPGKRDFPALTHNFRSAPEILRVVDETFSALLPGEYEASVAHRLGASGSVTVRFEHIDSEAAALAGAIVSAQGIPVWDEETGGPRPAGFGDMAVLIRSRSRLKAYEEALGARGIPFKVVGGVGFFRQDEVRAVMGILNFIDDPADTLSLAVALKSLLFGFSDGELERLYEDEDPMAALEELSPEAHGLVSGWRALSGVSGPGRIVEEVIDGSAAAFVFGLHRGPAALLNIEKLAGLAAEFDRRGGVGLAEFTAWVRSYKNGAELAGADVELPEFREFVSIMTVHAAKGLEFPVVFVADADNTGTNRTDRFLVGTARADDMAVRTDALLGDNPAYGTLKELEKEAAADEAVRLMYVAMTRAMDHLFVFAGLRPDRAGKFAPRDGSWASFLVSAAPASLMPEAMDHIEPPAACSYPAAPEPIGEKSTMPAQHCGCLAGRPRQAMLEPLPEPEPTGFVAPSSLAGPLPEEAGHDRPYTALLRGAAIHRALENKGRTGISDARKACMAQRGFGLLPPVAAAELVADVERTLTRLAADPDTGPLLSPGAGRHFELPLMLESGGNVVYGSADLVVVEGETAYVYDFKSGLAGTPHEAVADSYAAQLGAYRDAVSEAFGLSDVRTAILLTDTAEIIHL